MVLFKFNSLYKNNIFILFISTLFIGVFFTFFIIYFDANNLNNNLKIKDNHIRQWIDNVVYYQYNIGNLTELRRNLNSLAQSQSVVEGGLVNLDDEVIWKYQKEHEEIKVNHFIINTTMKWLYPDYSIEEQHLVRLRYALVNTDSYSLGSTEIVIDIQPELMSIYQRIKLMILILFSLLMLVFFAILYANKKIFKPLILFTNSIEKKISQLSSSPVRVSSGNEVERLTQSFDTLWDVWEQTRNKLLEQTKVAAIAQTTASLAHDVRKPFTMVKSVLDSFDHIMQNSSLLETFKKEINEALHHVQGMIDDIMDYSREVNIDTQPSRIEPIIEFVLNQLFQNESDFLIRFEYHFLAKQLPLLDEKRFSRVIANLVENAVEAITIMGKKLEGTITIETRDILLPFPLVQIIIRNDGPPFAEGVEHKLFESFFTSGKNTGTGLGLSSCHKIIALHNGTISAKNLDEGSGVEFVITLPASLMMVDSIEYDLPFNNQEIFKNFTPAVHKAPNYHGLQERNDRLTILLLEDELLYKAWVRRLIENDEILRKKFSLFETSTVEEAITLIGEMKINYAIVDIDLKASLSGLDFLDYVNQHQLDLPCLVHSNRTIQEFKDRAFALGAKEIVPKPLPLNTLLDFLKAFAPILSKGNEDNLPILLYFCDDVLVNRYAFSASVEDFIAEYPHVNLKTAVFEHGEALFDAVQEKTPQIVLTDQNMKKSGGILKGTDLIKIIKSYNPSIKTYLISNEDLTEMIEEVKKIGGEDAFEAPANKTILEAILL